MELLLSIFEDVWKSLPFVIHSLVAEHISFCHPHDPSFQGNFNEDLNFPRIAINNCGIPILDDESSVPL